MVENETRAMALGADAFRVKPIDRAWLLSSLESLIKERPVEKLLVVDDDEVSRYLLRGVLADTRFGLIEASNARDGLLLAREEKPRGIFLDLIMREADGFAVLDALKADPQTRDIPVFIHTSKRLSDLDRGRLQSAAAIISKETSSRDKQVAGVRGALIQAGLGTPIDKESR